MSGEQRNGWLEGRVRFLLLVAAFVASAVAFAWRSQASQDMNIGENEKQIAVTATKVDGVKEQLGKMDVKLDKMLDRLPRP